MVRKARTMAGQVVVITGALRGIGRAIAEAFVKTGSRVAISGRDEAQGHAVEKGSDQVM